MVTLLTNEDSFVLLGAFLLVVAATLGEALDLGLALDGGTVFLGEGDFESLLLLGNLLRGADGSDLDLLLAVTAVSIAPADVVISGFIQVLLNVVERMLGN